MSFQKYLGVLLGLSVLISCGGSSENNTSTPVQDGTVRVITYDNQSFNDDLYEAEAGLVKIEYSLDGFQLHTLVIEGLEESLKLEVGDNKIDSGEIELEAGRYILYCDVAGHRGSGMEAKLLVS
tara:strand:- start:1062 stop:1433 length:372 start_codon:yes stop_codon:yes gene_type:complete